MWAHRPSGLVQDHCFQEGTMTTTIRMLAAALAIAALGASGAQAQPADPHGPTIILPVDAAQQQDLRSPDARYAAQSPRDAGSPAARALPGPPTWPSHPQVIAPAVVAAPANTDSGLDWVPIAIGAGVSLLAMAALLGL